MSDEDPMRKLGSLRDRLKISGAEVGRKMSAGMSSMSFKMKEFFQGQNMADKIVDEATSESMEGPDWSTNLEICDMVNTKGVNSIELIRAIKRRIMLKNPRVQFLALVLLEALVKNCDRAFYEVAAERVLDEMVKLIDDPQTIVNNRNKALVLIETWGEAGDQLKYLPVYEETYKSLKSRGLRFPGRDDESLAPVFTPSRSVPDAAYLDATQQAYQELPDRRYGVPAARNFTDRSVPAVQSFTAEQTKESFEVAHNTVELLSTVLSSSPPQEVLKDDLTTTLVRQCLQCQYTIQRIIETAGENEAFLFEALNINDELQKVHTKYEELRRPVAVKPEPEPAMIPVTIEAVESPAVTKENASAQKPAGSGENEVLHDIDEMIFGNKRGSSSQARSSKEEHGKDDLLSF